MIKMNTKEELKKCAENVIDILNRNDDLTRGVIKALFEQVDNMANLLDNETSNKLPWED